MEELKEETTPKSVSKRSRGAEGIRVVDTYAAQCEKCLKWRVIVTPEDYEDIRSKITELPFVCERKPGVVCEDPADIEYDATRVWVIDRPDIPKTPDGFKRSLVLRRDFSKMDTYYITPTGKKLRTKSDVASFVAANPKYSQVSLSDFTFQSPKVMNDTIPETALKKSPTPPPTVEGKRKIKTPKDDA